MAGQRLGALLAAALSWWFGPWALLALLLVPVSGYAAWREAGRMGYAVDARLVAVRGGWWSRWWRFAEVDKLQALRLQRSPLDRWLGKLTLAPSGYGHFYVEHNRGHHKRVATPEDPASGRLGETVWEFMPRTMWGSLTSAWELEKKRFERLKKSHWSLKNDVLNAWLMSVVLWAVLLIVFGLAILPYLLLQAAVGIVLLEIVNYLEHYGLLRQKTESGRYERCTPEHSWNSDFIVTNLFFDTSNRIFDDGCWCP